MHRFFIDTKLHFAVNNRIDITDKDDIKHISKVLRIRIDEEIEICDGNGQEYICKVEEISNIIVKTHVIEVTNNNRESDIKISLFQSIPKGQKMELILQKSVELGVSEIVPMMTDRCVSVIKDKKTEKSKLERWQKVMDEAAKQSKRGFKPQILNVIKFDELETTLSKFDLVLIPHVLGNQKHLKKVLRDNKNAKNIAILIGPEGGFSETEVEKALNWNATPIKLGPRILRTETAGFVTSSVVMYELGDIGG